MNNEPDDVNQEFKVVECQCCGYAAELTEYENGMPRQKRMLCRVCSHTFLSHAVWFPELTKDQNLYKSIGWIANEILSRLPKENK